MLKQIFEASEEKQVHSIKVDAYLQDHGNVSYIEVCFIVLHNIYDISKIDKVVKILVVIGDD